MKLLEQDKLKELAKLVIKNRLFPVHEPKTMTKDDWGQALMSREQYLEKCKIMLKEERIADVLRYAITNAAVYPEYPGKKLEEEWKGFIDSKRKSIAKPITSNHRFEKLEVEVSKLPPEDPSLPPNDEVRLDIEEPSLISDSSKPEADEYNQLMDALEMEMHEWQATLFGENSDPNDPQLEALIYITDLIKNRDFEALQFEVRNYNFCFNPLFDNFPFERLKAAYLRSMHLSEEEFAPQNLGEIARRFKHMSSRYADDTDKKTKQFNPNTRVYSQIMATRAIGQNQMEAFVEIYRRSEWLQAVFPKEFLPYIAVTHEKNRLYDEKTAEFMTPLNRYNKDSATDRVVAIRNACLLQKNAALWNRIDDALCEAYRQVMAQKDAEMFAATEEQRSLRWSQHDEAKITEAKKARDLFAAGEWQQMEEHLKAHLPKVHQKLTEDLQTLLNDGQKDEFLYWPQVVATRAMMTYKDCLTKGTEREFLKLARPENVPYDHWTNRLERGEYHELHGALHEAYSYEPDVKKRVEAAFNAHMPQKLN